MHDPPRESAQMTCAKSGANGYKKLLGYIGMSLGLIQGTNSVGNPTMVARG